MAWMQSFDTNYMSNVSEWKLTNSYKKISINCPVDVAVYDSQGKQVSYIKNDEVQNIENGLTSYVDYIQMPVMDGYTATAALRSLRRDDAKTTIILAMTANVFSDDVIKAEASGMNGHISKPFDPDKLYAMIAASCHKKRGDGPAG